MSTIPARPGERAIEAERQRTRSAQAGAADPVASAWVSANAGTGKTHVLTMRVLRLLVAGTKPERLLCLTYTKAAAAEMSERVFDRLAQWATATEVKLTEALTELLMRAPEAEELARARDLFTIAIETPGGLKVQTIHAFAERLLQRFPLEAGIPPKFAILDDETAGELRREAIEYVLTEASREPASLLGQAMTTAIAWAVDDGFDKLLADALTKRDWIEAAVRLDRNRESNDELAAAEHLYRRMLGLSGSQSVASVEKMLAGVLADADLELACRILNAGSTNDQKMAKRFAEARGATGIRARIEALTSAFLTDDGDPRKSLMTKPTAKAHPDVDAVLTRAQDQFARAYDQRNTLVVLGSTMALMRIAVAVHQHYRLLKNRRAALDFDDLIRHTASLLSTSGQAQWVLFKLDGGLDHILVDEAQDTSPPQWKIVQALAEEFFAGDGTASAGTRTLFAVGDEKQSIYGFQGAAPEEFARMGDQFEALARQARQVWRRVPLTLSFRSAAPLLELVDRVFADPLLASTITTSGDAIHHVANRTGACGLVEIWDTEKTDDATPSEVWAPLADTTATSPVVRLADRIAATIEHWIASRETLASEARPIRAGDIIVLVRKRRPFADAMVSALKARNIPVAGADRMRLSDQIAIQDLLALADFLLLPEDDLALANVLKSPLFDLTDDDLLAIAPARPRTLWSALLRHAEKSPRFAEAATLLKRWRSRSDLHPPYEFFVEVLDRDGMRQRLLTRLGSEAADPIDEFMRLALTFDDSEPPSLQGFVANLRGSDREIKRDMEHGRNEVRVMTVHGAKGLEAPIVFLPDTCSSSSGARPGGLITAETDDGILPLGVADPFLWPVKGTKAVNAVVQARAAIARRDSAERNRLLYVALTRPRDRVYVAGFEGAKGRDRGCWYDVIEQSLGDALTEHQDHTGRRVRRLQSPQIAPPEQPRRAAEASLEAQLPPAWARSPAPREPGLAVPLAPSRLAPLETDAEGDPIERRMTTRDPATEPAPLPPAAQADGHRFLRGTLTHALLEHLPTLDPAHWETAATAFIEARGAPLRAKTRKSIVVETLAVLRDTAFAPIFGPGSRAEVPIVAELHAAPSAKGQVLRVTGQLDRLVVLDHEVLIVDYKTNRPPPLLADAVAETYVLQLAAYRLAVSRIFPGKPVRAALLWTDGPRLMIMPDDRLDAAEKRLFTLDRGSLDAP